MAFDFPTAPALDDEYTSGGVTYKFNGTGWTVVGASSPTIAEPPADTLAYGRTNTAGTGAWKRAVEVDGDTMTGSLINESLTGFLSKNAQAYSGFMCARDSVPVSICYGQDPVSGDGKINVSQTANALRLSIATQDVCTIRHYGLYVRAASAGGTYALEARADMASSTGVIGWSLATTYYGCAGYYDGVGTHYSLYGNTGAFISAGTWATSDIALKEVTGALDTAAALATVNAVPVKTFTPKNEAAMGMLYGNGDSAELYGWVAQDIEPLIPLAVRDVRLPADDLISRSAIRNVTPPTRDTPDATALGAENITVKAINDHYMLTQLWAAVQQLSAEVEALKAAR